MFAVVERWAHAQPNRGAGLNDILSSESVRAGKNEPGDHSAGHNHGGLPSMGNMFGSSQGTKEATGRAHVWQESTTAPWEASREGTGTAHALGAEFPGTETAYDSRNTYGHTPDPQQTYGYGAPPPQGGYGQPFQEQPQQPGAGYPAYGAGDGYQYSSQGGGAPAPGYGSGAWGER